MEHLNPETQISEPIDSEAAQPATHRSTGPRTPEGKRIAALNRLSHTSLGKTVLIPGESAKRFAALVNAFYAEHNPQTPTERAIVDKLATIEWRLRRIRTIEASAIAHELGIQDTSTPPDPPIRAMLALRTLGGPVNRFDLISRQEQRYDRQQDRALKALARTRRDRLERQKLNFTSENPEPHENKESK